MDRRERPAAGVSAAGSASEIGAVTAGAADTTPAQTACTPTMTASARARAIGLWEGRLERVGTRDMD